MKVIKKDRRTEDFDINKIKITLMKASEKVASSLDSSDIDLLLRLIKKRILSDFNGVIKTKEIKKIVLEELIKLDFNSVANLYENYIKQQ